MYPVSGSHTVWCGIVPDLAGEKARKIWMDKLEQEHVNIGVSGYKVDEVDGYDRYVWPDVATFPSGIAAEQMRQTYGLWVQRTTAELYKKRNQRTFGLVRASNAGATSFPYVIYNDYYSHPDFITALINSGFSGVLWTPEVRSSKVLGTHSPRTVSGWRIGFLDHHLAYPPAQKNSIRYIWMGKSSTRFHVWRIFLEKTAAVGSFSRKTGNNP